MANTIFLYYKQDKTKLKKHTHKKELGLRAKMMTNV